MADKLLFSIPIYNDNPDVFSEKAHKKYEKEMSWLLASGHTDDESRRYISYIDKNMFTRENYMIGFLELLLDVNKCIKYRLLLAQSEKYIDDKNYKYVTYKMPLCTHKKHYYSDIHIGGMYVPIKGRTNEEIINDIKEDIELIKQDDCKGLFLDMRAFDNIIYAINFELIG